MLLRLSLSWLVICACTPPEKTPVQGEAPDDTGDGSNGGDSGGDNGGDSAGDSAGDSDDSPDDSPDDSAGEATPCFTYAPPIQTGTVSGDELNEISDVLPSRRNPGVLWVLEDSGNDSVLTAIDTAGNTLGTVALDADADAENGGINMIDWEDLAWSACAADGRFDPAGAESCLWVGDIGDNMVNRTHARLISVVEPDLSQAAPPFALTLPGRVHEIPYPDAPHNAESLAFRPEGPVILSKRDMQLTGVYLIDLDLMTMSYAGDLPLDASTATAADLWPDGSRILVRTYNSLLEYWLSSSGIADTVNVIRVPVPVGPEHQGESASYDPALRGYWTISEGLNPPIWFAGCASEQ